MSHILIVEDEPVIRGALRKLLERHNYSVVEAESVEDASENQNLNDFDLIISDLRLPGAAGTDIIELSRPTPVLIMTSYASLRSAVDAMRQGAVDYVAKPFDHDEMIMSVERVLKERSLVRNNANLQADLAQSWPVTDMIGESNAMQELFRRIDKIAVTDTPVLITGESGTGKELVARALHARSPRHQGPLISVNCAALQTGTIEQELFGTEQSEQGEPQKGLAEEADNGSLFLDEIGELPASIQARLLTLLESGEIRRAGGKSNRRVDVRLITTSQYDMNKLVARGKFREDLFYRLNVMQMQLPPLRERGHDIQLLADMLLEKCCNKLNQPPLTFNEEARDAMQRYCWPGNVRELANAIERACILSDTDEVTPDLLALDLSAKPVETSMAPAKMTDPQEDLSLEDYFARFVLENQDSMTETELARKLGISRKSLWERRQRLGIPRKKNQDAKS